MNQAYEDNLIESGLTISGRDDNGKARIIELNQKKFFIATAFQPHMTSSKENLHPVLKAFIEAAKQGKQQVK